jgi:hypothetical protein
LVYIQRYRYTHKISMLIKYIFSINITFITNKPKLMRAQKWDTSKKRLRPTDLHTNI